MNRSAKPWLLGVGVVALALGAFGFASRAPAQGVTTQCVNNVAAQGTSDAITSAQLPCGTTTNLVILTAAATNTTGAPTYAPVGSPPLVITRANGTPVVPGDLIAGYTALLTSTGTSWVLLNPANFSFASGVAIPSNVTTLPDAGPTINAALVAAATVGPLDVYLPWGVITVQTPIKATAGVHLHGQGGANYGVCGTTLTWTGSAGGTLYDASVTTGHLVNPGLTDMCLNGNGLAGTVFNKRGVSWGEFTSLVIYGGVNYGVYEDVAVTSPTADQLTQWRKIQVLCTSGECWTTGPGTTTADITENFYRDLDVLPSGAATAGFHCNGGDGNTFIDFFGQSAGGGVYDFIAGPGTTNTPYSDSCRENTFIGLNVFKTGVHIVASGALHSYGNLLFGLKVQDSGPVVVDSGAGFTWHDSLGTTHSVASTDMTSRMTLGAADTSEASVEVNEAVNSAVVGKFGATLPLYVMANNPTLGFGTYWNGTNNVYGDGASANYAAQLAFNATTGALNFNATSASGNAGATATLPTVFSVGRTGGVTDNGLPSSAGGGGLYVCVDTSGVFYKKAACP